MNSKTRELREARGLVVRAVRQINSAQVELINLPNEFRVDERDTALHFISEARKTLAELEDKVGNIPGCDPFWPEGWVRAPSDDDPVGELDSPHPSLR